MTRAFAHTPTADEIRKATAWLDRIYETGDWESAARHAYVALWYMERGKPNARCPRPTDLNEHSPAKFTAVESTSPQGDTAR